ncbi:hypothetical protein [Thalassobellus suaedae]|uniref:hypothetical protein n=1 Tax=Thalassobellus suaedae TaxID=3074124 RepID=UPI0039F5184D
MNFNPSRLNEVWVSDITYIQTNQGWLYLTTIIDFLDEGKKYMLLPFIRMMNPLTPGRKCH